MYHNKQNNATHVPSSQCVSFSISHATAINKTKQIKCPVRSALIYFFDLLFFIKQASTNKPKSSLLLLFSSRRADCRIGNISDVISLQCRWSQVPGLFKLFAQARPAKQRLGRINTITIVRDQSIISYTSRNGSYFQATLKYKNISRLCVESV